MCSIKAILLGFLILGVFNSAFSKPSTPSDNAKEETDDDYAGDDDYTYDDDDENKSGQTNKEDNSVHPALSPPYFEKTEYSREAAEGDLVQLECGAKNLAADNVILWYNKTMIITQSKFRTNPDTRISVDDNYTLSINKVRQTDSSDYYCQVLPTNITMKATLIVAKKITAAIFDNEGKEITGRQITYPQGQRIEIECKGFGDPEPHMKWFSEGERVANGVNGVHLNNGILTIDHADHHHVKLYQCLADNGFSIAHATFTINVHYSPKVNAHRHIVNTKDGEDAELHCNYKSTVMSKVTWHKDGNLVKISNQDKYSTHNETKDKHHESNILKIKNIEKSDLGDYECEVQNSIGKGHIKIHLGYEPEPPRFDRLEVNGDTIISHWIIKSLQPLNEVMINYQKSGAKTWLSEKPIHSEKTKEHSGIWRIQHKLSLESGTWNARVKAKNVEGWSVYSEQEKLVIPANFDIDEYEPSLPNEDAVIQKAGIAGSSAVIYRLSSAVCLLSLVILTLFRRI